MIALLTSLLAAAGPASGVQYRTFVSQAPALLANLEAHPEVRSAAFAGAELQIVIKRFPEDFAPLRAVMDRAAKLGFTVVPGMICLEGEPAGHADRARWQRNADRLAALLRAYPALAGQRVSFDIEDYDLRGLARAPSLEAQRAAMAPFLEVLVPSKIVPVVNPAMPDELVTRAIADAVGGRAELWTQQVFDHSERLRKDPIAARESALVLARLRTQFARRWPAAVVRHGAYDHLLRAWGAPARAQLDDYGPHAPWIFDINRKDTKQAGTPAWLRGTSISSTNDVRHAWVAPPLSVAPVPGAPPLLPVEAAPLAGGARSDLRSAEGLLLAGGRVLRANDVLPRDAGDFTVVVELVLPPSGGGPLFGASQLNSESWQVVHDGARDRVLLELRHAGAKGGPVVTFATVIEPAPRGAPLRIAIARRGPVWSTSARTLAVVHPVAKPAGHLWIGGGVAMARGTGARAYDGLVVRGAEVWHRALGAEELAAVEASAYPRL